MPDIRSLLVRGQEVLATKHDQEEEAKRGTLRGGNSGVILSSGDILGKCHRLSYLRSKGLETPNEPDKELMFAAGRTNEDSWMDVLKESWHGTIKQEEECPVVWTTDSGVTVSGRPDIILCDSAEKPLLGLELKLASSVWTAISVLLKGAPKTDHLIQAAHYSWVLDLPFELWYTSRVNWQLPYWKWVTELAEEWSGPEVGWKESRGKMVPAKLFPFYVGYKLWWHKGQLAYQREGSTERVDTDITVASIKSYYEFVATMEKNKDLGPRPASIEIDGSKMGWNKCDAKYCPLSEVCDNHEGDFDRWFHAAKKKLESSVTSEEI